MQKISIQKLKWLKSLQLKKNRDKEQCFVIEGEKIVLECINQIPEKIEIIACLSEQIGLIPQGLKFKCLLITNKDLDRISNQKSPNKLFAVIKKSTPNPFNPNLNFLILDNIQDPGNMGTIIRTADWFGIHQIICSENCVDVYNSKVLQSSMGSFLRVTVRYKELISFLEESNFNITGAFLHGTALEKEKIKNSNAIMLGNEGHGISPELEKYCNQPVKIKGLGGAESLNVSSAASILMYEWTK